MLKEAERRENFSHIEIISDSEGVKEFANILDKMREQSPTGRIQLLWSVENIENGQSPESAPEE